MQFTSSLFAVCALALSGANAAVLPRQADPYVGDYRTFSNPGCETVNQGVGTITESLTSQCFPYSVAFKSLYAHYNEGWTWRVHTTRNCSDEGTIVESTPSGEDAICNNDEGEAAWVAHSIYPAYT